MRQQPVPVPAAGRAGPAAVHRGHAGGVHGRGDVPADRRAVVPADAARPRVLLVPAAARPRGTASLQAGIGRPPAVSRLTSTSPGKGRLMIFEDVLAAWLVKQRWFVGKGRTVHDLAVVADTEIIPGDPGLRHLLVTVSHGATSDCYQLFVGMRARLPSRLRHARIGAHDGLQYYDGLHDSDLTRALLDAIVANRTVGTLQFCRMPGAEIEAGLDSL